MRWLFWTGGVIALAGLTWLVSEADVSAGGPSTSTAVWAIALFLGGLVIAGIGMRADRPDT